MAKNESRSKLYKGLVDQGLYTKSEEDFNSQFSSQESRSKLYYGLKDKGLYTKSEEDFNTQFFSDVKKKETSSSVSTTTGGESELFDETTQKEQELPSVRGIRGYSDTKDMPIQQAIETEYAEKTFTPPSEQTSYQIQDKTEEQVKLQQSIEDFKTKERFFKQDQALPETQEEIDRYTTLQNNKLKRANRLAIANGKEPLTRINPETMKLEPIQAEPNKFYVNTKKKMAEYDVNDRTIKTLESTDDIARNLPQVQETIKSLVDKNSKLKGEIKSDIEKFEEAKIKDRNAYKSKSEILDDEYSNLINEENSKIMDGLFDIYIQDKDILNRIESGEDVLSLDQKEEATESFAQGFSDWLESIDLDKKMKLEGIKDPNELASVYFNEIVFPKLIAGSKGQESFLGIEGPLRETFGDVLGDNYDDIEPISLSEDELDDLKNQAFVGHLIVNKGVDPTKVLNIESDALYAVNQIIPSIFKGITEAGFLGMYNPTGRRSQTEKEITKDSFAATESSKFLDKAGVKVPEGWEDKKMPTTREKWVNSTADLVEFAVQFPVAGSIRQGAFKFAKGLGQADDYIKFMAKMEKVAKSNPSKFKMLIAKSAVLGENAIKNGITQEIYSITFNDENVGLGQGMAGSTMGDLTKGLLSYVTPKNKVLQSIVNRISSGTGEFTEELGEELYQNDWDLSNISQEDLTILATLSFGMGAVMGGTKNNGAYYDMYNNAMRNLDSEYKDIVKDNLGLKEIEKATEDIISESDGLKDSPSDVGQTVEPKETLQENAEKVREETEDQVNKEVPKQQGETEQVHLRDSKKDRLEAEKLEPTPRTETIKTKGGKEVKLTREETKQDKEIEAENKSKQPIRDAVGMVNDYNSLSIAKKKTDDAKRLLNQINDFASKNNMSVGRQKGKVVLLNNDGKKVSKPLLKETNKEKYENYRTKNELKPESQKVFDDMKKTGMLDFKSDDATRRLDIDLPPKEFDGAIKDIESGVRSGRAEKVLEFIDRVERENNIPLSVGSGANITSQAIPLEYAREKSAEIFKEELKAPESAIETLKSKDDVDFALDPENKDYFISEGFTDQEYNEIYDTARDLKEGRSSFSPDGNILMFTPTKPETSQEIAQPEKKKSQRAERIEATKDIDARAKELLKPEDKYYETLSDKKSISNANEYINKQGGLKEAINSVKNRDKSFEDLPAKDRNVIQTVLARNIQNSINAIENSTLDSDVKDTRINNLLKDLENILTANIELGTDIGQGLQSMKVWSEMFLDDPVVAIRYAKKRVDSSRKKGLKDQKQKRDLAESVQKEGNEFAVKEVVKELKDVSKKAVSKTKSLNSKAKKKAQKDADSALNDIANIIEDFASGSGIIKKAEGGKVQTTPELLKQLLPALTKLADALIRLGHYNYKEWKQKFSKKTGGRFDDVADKVWEQVSEKAIAVKEDYARFETEKAIRKEIKDTEQKLEDIVKEHYTVVNAYKTSLADKIIKEIGLEADDAKNVADKIQSDFDKIATVKKKQILDRKMKPRNTSSSKTKQYYEKVIENTNLGALDSKDHNKMMEEFLEVESLTPESISKITELSDKIASSKGDKAKKSATLDMMDYIMELQGFNKTFSVAGKDISILDPKIGMSLYIANLFSGITTQAINVWSNTQNLMIEPLVLAIAAKDASVLSKSAKTMWNALPKAIAEAKNIMKTGKVTHRGIAPDTRTLEILRDKASNKFLKYYATFGSTVFRALSAMDALFYTTAKEAKFMVDVMEAGKKSNLKGDDLERYIKEQINPSKESFNQALETANNEGLQGNQAELRAYEIMDEGRDIELIETASEYAANVTFTDSPKGVLGMVGKGLNNIIDQAPYLKFFLPVVNTPINVINRGLDFTPYGYFRYKTGGLGPLFGKMPKSEAFYKDNSELLARSIIGSSAMATMMGLFTDMPMGDEEDENLFTKLTGVKFKVHGNGPRSFQEKYALQETGWMPNSIQIGDTYISYTSSPLNFAFSLIGMYNDSGKYVKEQEDQKTRLNRVGIAMAHMPNFIADMSFVSSVKDLLEMTDFKEGDLTGGLSKKLLIVGSNIIAPNTIRQIDKFFDPTILDKKKLDGLLYKMVPFAHHLVNDKPVILNDFGEPVEAYPASKQFLQFSRDNELYDLRAEKNFHLPRIAPSASIYFRSKGEKIYIHEDPKMSYDFSRAKGRKNKEEFIKYKSRIEKLDPINDRDQLDRIRQSINSASTNYAKNYVRSKYDK